MSPSPKVALIGCGLIARKRMNALPAGSVPVVCDVDLKRAKQLAASSPGCVATDSVEEAVSWPAVDVVMIATPNASLAPISCLALKAGKHVLVEKPGAISVAELDVMEALANEQGKLVRIGYNHRYHPAALKAVEFLKSGALGPMMFVRGRYGQGGRLGYE